MVARYSLVALVRHPSREVVSRDVISSTLYLPFLATSMLEKKLYDLNVIKITILLGIAHLYGRFLVNPDSNFVRDGAIRSVVSHGVSIVSLKG